MAEGLRRVGVSVTIELVFSTDFVDEAQARAAVQEVVDAALNEVENEVDNEYTPGVYGRVVKGVRLEAFRLPSEYAATEPPAV